MNRRRFLCLSGLVAGRSLLAAPLRPRTRLVLLGTAGGPRPKADRSAPSQAIAVDDSVYVIDCGNGVARQLVRAGFDLRLIRAVFLTHHHSDHNADYGNLFLLAWAGGLTSPIDAYGPPPLEKMTRAFFEQNAYDIETRVADEGRPALGPLVRPHEITRAGAVFRDPRVAVTAALVNHPPVAPAFAYRVDGPDRSIVISGDTARSEELIALARGADVLVHEALDPAAVDRIVGAVAGGEKLKAHILGSHTPVEEVGRVAQEAGVKMLVLSHLVPSDDPEVTEATWLEGARRHFRGEVVVGADLMEV